MCSSDLKESATEVSAVDVEDLENQPEEKPRQIVLIQPMLGAATLLLTILAIGSGWRQIAIETYVDRNYVRAAFAAVALPQMWLALVRCTI